MGRDSENRFKSPKVLLKKEVEKMSHAWRSEREEEERIAKWIKQERETGAKAKAAEILKYIGLNPFDSNWEKGMQSIKDVLLNPPDFW